MKKLNIVEYESSIYYTDVLYAPQLSEDYEFFKHLTNGSLAITNDQLDDVKAAAKQHGFSTLCQGVPFL